MTKIKKEENFLKTNNIKCWATRLKLNSPLKYIYFIFAGIAILIENIFLMPFALTKSIEWMSGLMNAIVFFFFLFLGLKIYNNFPILIEKLKEEGVLGTSEIFDKYKATIIKKFKSKFELIFPLLAGIAGAFFAIISGFVWWLAGVNVGIVVLYAISIGIVFFLLWLIALSGFILLVIMYRCLNKLGRKKNKEGMFPLNIQYKHLKIGIINEIGKFIIAFTIPTVILGTILGVFGLFYIFIQDIKGAGYIYIITGLVIDILMVFLLYKNTIHIHNSIVDTKSDLLSSLAADIQEMTKKLSSEIETPKKYEAIMNMINFYESIQSVSDWPFNPTSIKKLAVTLISSVVPLALSFFGLG